MRKTRYFLTLVILKGLLSFEAGANDVTYGGVKTDLDQIMGRGTQTYLFDSNRKKLFLISEGDEERELYSVKDFSFREKPYLTPLVMKLGKRTLWDPKFNSKTGLFYLTSDETGDENLNIYTLDPYKKKFRRITNVGYFSGRTFSPDNGTIYFAGRMNKTGGEHCIFKTSAIPKPAPGQEKVICDQLGQQIYLYSNPYVSADGQELFFTTMDQGDRTRQNLARYNLRTGAFTVLLNSAIGRNQVWPLLSTSQGLFFVSDEGGSEVSIFLLKNNSNEVEKVRGGYAGFRPVYLRELNRVVIAEKPKSKNLTRLSLWDPVVRKDLTTLESDNIFESYSVAASTNSGGILFTMGKDLEAADKLFYLNAKATKPKDLIRVVFEREKGVQRLSECRTSLVQYPTFDTNADGSPRMIEAYVYEPLRARSERAGIVMAHGGPSSRWSGKTEFNLAQLFCRYGYYAIAANVRGSTGYGKAFEDLNNRDWGGGDHLDYEYAGRYLSQAFRIPRTRIGIYGFSYGGYMAAWAATQAGRTNQFAFAMSGAPFTDLFIQYKESTIPDNTTTDMGTPTDPETIALYTERSPVTHVAHMSIPLLLFHGDADYRCPYRQTAEFNDKLLALGKDVKLITMSGEAHGVRYRKSRAEVYQAMLDLLLRVADRKSVV